MTSSFESIRKPQHNAWAGDVPGDQQRASGSDEGVRTQIRKRTRSNDFCFRVGRMTGAPVDLSACSASELRDKSLDQCTLA